MISNRYFIVSAVTFLLIFGVVFLQFQASEQTLPTDIVKIRYGTTPFLGEAPVYVAYKKGYFKEQGLDLTLVKNAAGFLNLKALFENRVDIANVADLPIAYSILNKLKYTDFDRGEFQIFGDMIYSNKIQQVLARRDRGIEQPSDIVGKRVALMRGTTSDFFYDAFLTEYDINPASVQAVNLSVADQVDALVRGDIDAIFSWQPHILRAQNALADNAVTLESNLTYTTTWLAVAMTEYIKARPDVLVRFLHAINKANNFISNNPQQAMVIHAEMSGVDLDTISHLWSDIDYELSLSESLLTTIESEMRWIYRKKNIENKEIPNVMPYLYFDAMEHVAPKNITIIR